MPIHVIHGNNVELFRTCAFIPNVHLAYHKDIRPQHMYDYIHLNKKGVQLFARVLKSTAFGKTENSRNLHGKSSSLPQRNVHPPPRTRQDSTPGAPSQSYAAAAQQPCSRRTQSDKTPAQHHLLQTCHIMYKSNTHKHALKMTVNINVEYSRLEFNSLWTKKFKHRFPEEHQRDGYYNSTGDMEQGRRHHPLSTQLQRNHPTSQKLSTVRQGRDSGGQIIWYKSKFHNRINTVKEGKYYTWLKIHKELLPSRKDIFLCAIYIPPSESPYYSEDMFSTLE